MPKTLYLVRHGETDFNSDPEPRIRGRIELDLNQIGIKNALKTASFLNNIHFDSVLSSEINRAKQTAHIIISESNENHNKRIQCEPDLIDVCWGDWEGKTFIEVFSNNSSAYMKAPNKIQPPNGETFSQVLHRMDKMMHKINECKEETICIVSHGSVFSVLACYMLQMPLDKIWSFYMNNCAVSKVIMKDIDTYQICYWNQTHHLE
ncbi:6-bisphosphate 2-phosphatase [Hexamita inflata]|uniref:6-bisphosphate 2-phosphatase n=1 Tax=Hexamita inflata TaxID=28002 RepID=A0AA86RBF8_9EUKA|nr:6-bisphosphate 2-phosphatase [Hexamita inflata]